MGFTRQGKNASVAFGLLRQSESQAPDLPEHFVSVLEQRDDAAGCVDSFAQMIKRRVVLVILPKPEELPGTCMISLHHLLKQTEA